MNAFASRGVEGVGFGRVMSKPRLSKRPRTFVAALIGTWVAFMWLVNRYAMLAQREHHTATPVTSLGSLRSQPPALQRPPRD